MESGLYTFADVGPEIDPAQKQPPPSARRSSADSHRPLEGRQPTNPHTRDHSAALNQLFSPRRSRSRIAPMRRPASARSVKA